MPIPATYGFTVNENVATGTAVGTVARDRPRQRPVPFNAAALLFPRRRGRERDLGRRRYTINATSGVITTDAALNYEAGVHRAPANTVAVRDNAGNGGYVQAISRRSRSGSTILNDPNSFDPRPTYAFHVD